MKSADRPELNESYVYEASGNIIEKTIIVFRSKLDHGLANQLKVSHTGSETTRYRYDPSSYCEEATDERIPVAERMIGRPLNGTGRNGYSNPEIEGLVRRSLGEGGCVTEDEKFFVSDYLGNTMMELPGKESTEFDKGRHDTAGFSFLTTAMGANVESDGSLAGEESNPAMNRFTGKPYDEDLQAYVFPFRNYSAKLGRWTSADPAGFPDGPNRHFYAPVPTAGLDPMGLHNFVFGGGVSQSTKDAFSNVESSAYGQDPNSSFNQVANGQSVLVVEVKDGSGSYFGADGRFYIDPTQATETFALKDSDGNVYGDAVSLESIIAHEVKHIDQRRKYTPAELNALRNTPGVYGGSALEDQAIDEANLYRSGAGEDYRIWSGDYSDYIKNEI